MDHSVIYLPLSQQRDHAKLNAFCTKDSFKKHLKSIQLARLMSLNVFVCPYQKEEEQEEEERSVFSL